MIIRTQGGPADPYLVVAPPPDPLNDGANIDVRWLEAFCEPFEDGQRMFRETTANVSRHLFTLVRLARPQLVLEMGCHIGATTVWLALALRFNDRARRLQALSSPFVDEFHPGPRLVAYDTDAAVLVNCGNTLTDGLGAWSDTAELVKADAVRELRDEHRRADFVFIDIEPKRDYEMAFDGLDVPVGGVVCAHDLTLFQTSPDPDAHIEDGPGRLYRRLRNDPNWDAICLPWERGLMVARKVNG